jgi:hypothetical protein
MCLKKIIREIVVILSHFKFKSSSRLARLLPQQQEDD